MNVMVRLRDRHNYKYILDLIIDFEILLLIVYAMSFDICSNFLIGKHPQVMTSNNFLFFGPTADLSLTWVDK